MLFSARKRLQETAAREADGQSLWRDDFDEQALVRIAEAYHLIEQRFESPLRQPLRVDVAQQMRAQAGWQVGQVPPDGLVKMLDNTGFVLDSLGAIYIAISNLNQSGGWAEKFATAANKIMREHRIAYKFVEGELVSFESDEMLATTVEPALKLLVGNTFAAAHDAYLSALKEIGRGDAGDAITDAGTALQEVLTALGCTGNALGPLIKDAKRLGLFAGHDQNLVDGIGKFMDWASADRSTSGDAHKHSQADVADAWLMVHIVGALVVRLVDPALRGSR